MNRIIIILIFFLTIITFVLINYLYTNKYFFGIMLIFKNEEEYLEEWLDYHIKQGIDRFYLYCNDENIEKYNYLSTEKYKKFIKLINWTDKKNEGVNTIQRQAYFDCVSKYSNECKYLMMLDTDEFLVNKEQDNTVIDFVKKLNYNNTKALKVQRYNFGSNGKIKKPFGGVIENYTKHEKICSSFKTIANTSFIDKTKQFFGVHDFNFINKNGDIYNKYLNYDSAFPNGCKEENINEIPLIINHYFTKSQDEYIRRCELWKDGGINPIGYRNDCNSSFKKKDENINEIYDDTIIIKN